MSTVLITLDSQLTEMKKVMSEDANMDRMFTSAIESAEKFSVLITDIQKQMIGFARMGFSEKEIIQLSETAAALQQVGGLSSDESVSVLTASMTQFREEVTDTMQIVDKMNNIENNNATTIASLSEGLQRAGDSSKAFGVSLDNTLSYITAIQTSTRESGNVVGNSLKSIFSRVTTLSESVSALGEIGIQVENADGTYRRVEDILAELAGTWGSLNNAQQQNIAVTVAGRYQLSRFEKVA